MGTTGPRDLTLDTGALIAFDKGDQRLRALVRAGLAAGVDIAIPSAALAQAWRDGRTQARLAGLMGDRRVRVEPLSKVVAQAAGALCGRAATTDVIDASVVLCARRQPRGVVVTSDPDEIARLDGAIAVASV